MPLEGAAGSAWSRPRRLWEPQAAPLHKRLRARRGVTISPSGLRASLERCKPGTLRLLRRKNAFRCLRKPKRRINRGNRYETCNECNCLIIRALTRLLLAHGSHLTNTFISRESSSASRASLMPFTFNQVLESNGFADSLGR
jgi:hypothetical protein